jgi:hypothetical protein
MSKLRLEGPCSRDTTVVAALPLSPLLPVTATRGGGAVLNTTVYITSLIEHSLRPAGKDFGLDRFTAR